MKNNDYQVSKIQPMHKPMELAKQLNMSRATMYRLLKSGKLGSVKVGGMRLVPEDEVLRLFSSARG